MNVAHRFGGCGALVAVALAMGCPPATPPAAELPSGIPVADLPPAQQALLRLTLAIDGGVLAESDLVLDGTTISGDVALNNVEADGDRTARLRLYGRAAADTAEVLLGEATREVFIARNGESRVDFTAADVFDTCGAAAPPCALRYDVNRNGDSNLVDLLPADKAGRGIDPAPQAPVLDVAPATLQFPSGVAVGTFARQVIVLENVGPHPIRVVQAEVVAAPGAGLALFDPTGAPSSSSKRRLDGALFPGDIAAGAEQLIAVNFAPANSFLTTGAVHVVVEDTVTGVRQTARVRLIGNPDGAVRVPGAGDIDADAFSGTVAVPVFTWPIARLASGAPATSADPAAADGLGLAAVVNGAVALADTTSVGADVAYVVELPAGQRLSVSLAGLATDVDLAVVDLDATDVATGIACAACTSKNAGTSPEGVDLQNDTITDRRLLVVLDRVDLDDAPTTVPFELSILRSDAPSFVDDAPVSPATGPLEGGTPVTLIGRGWDARASIRIGASAALDVQINTDPGTGLSTASCTVPPGPLDPAAASAVVVVQNPAVVDGGDGQAAVLPDGYLYQPPAPRLDAILPAVASTGTNIAPVLLTGAFFSRRAGEPVVLFDDVAVDGTFIDSATIEVVPPSSRPAGTAFVSVRNRLGRVNDVELLSGPSGGRPFTFLVSQGPAPVVTTVTPAEASVDGGDVITIAGTNFGADCSVFIGGAAAPVTVTSSTSLQVTVPPRITGGRTDVVVQNADGQATVVRGGFTYVIPAPAVEGVFPTRAASTGGTLVSVAGVGFRPGARARFVDAASAAIDAAGQTVVSSRSLLVGCPPLTAGTWSLVIENLDGTTATFPGFSVFTPVGLGPQAIALEPAAGSALGGTEVTFVGRNLVDVTVTVGAATLPRQQTSLVRGVGGAPDRVTFVTPPAPGGAAQNAAVQIINGDGQTTSLAFSYVADGEGGPRIDAVTPARISGTHPVTIAVTGANFAPGATVLVGGVAVPAAVTSTTISCDVPARPAGSASLTVTNPDGTQTSFPLQVTGAPVIAGLSTSSVHALVPGDQVIVIGDALDVDPIDDLTITGPLGDEPGTVVQAANGFLVVEVPGLAGDDNWGVQVDYAGGDTATSPQTFEAVPPTIEEVNPIVVGGAVLLEVIGDALNPAAFDGVVLAAGGQPTSTCVPLSKTERRVLCRPQPALVPGVDYGATLAWEGTFAGEAIPVTLPALFVGTEDPVVVTGETLVVSDADRALPSDVNLAGFTFTVSVPGAVQLADMTATIDGVVAGDVVSVSGDTLTVACRPLQFAAGVRPLVIQTGGFDYAIGGDVTFAPSATASVSPSTLTWPAGFTTAGTYGSGETLVAVRTDDAAAIVDLPTLLSDGGLAATSTTGLSAGLWTVCSSATRTSCAGPVLTVVGRDTELEGQATALEAGAPASGAFDGGGDVWFVHATAGSPIVATLDATAPCSAGATVEIWQPSSSPRTATGRRIASRTAPTGTCHAGVAGIAPTTGEYVVAVTTDAGTGPYTIAVETAPTELEPNDVNGNPIVVVAGQTYASGTLSSGNDLDLQTFSLSTPQTIAIDLDVGTAAGQGCDVPLRVRVLRLGATVAEAVGQGGVCPRLTTPVLAPGSYAVAVSSVGTPPVTPTWAMSWSSGRCGDGVVAGAEACDDGGTANGDGCSSVCAVEGNAICVGAPSRCVTDVIFLDDMESGDNGWTQTGADAWAQGAIAGNTTWQWSAPAEGPSSIDDVLVSPPVDLSLVEVDAGGVFFACGHRDDRLTAETIVGVEVLTATGVDTPTGPVQPVAGYSTDGGWGPSGSAAIVRDVFDLTPWAGATSVTLGIHVVGAADAAVESRWFFDDVSVVGALGALQVPVEWSCSDSFYGVGDGCDCGCGAVDPDCASAAVSSCDYCDNLGSCNGGGGCPGDIDADNNATCAVLR